MAQEIHKDDVGTKFVVKIQDGNDIVDLSAATQKQILFLKPSTGTITGTASFLTDGTDGILTYTAVTGDLDETGDWFLQARLDFGSSMFRSNKEPFEVFGNIA